MEQAIGGLLEQAGITVKVNSVPKAVFFPQVDKGDFTMYFAGWGSNNAIATWGAVYHSVIPRRVTGLLTVSTSATPMPTPSSRKLARFRRRRPRQGGPAGVYQADRVKFAYLPLYYEDVIAGIADNIAYTSRADEMILAWQMKRKQ